MADAQKERVEQAEKAQRLEEERAQEAEKHAREQERAARAEAERAAEAERVQRLEAERAEQAEKRAKEQKESANKLRGRAFVAAGAAGVALILLVVSVFLWRKSESASAKAKEQARIAAIQRNEAEEQARRAEEQTRIAESRRLAGESSSALAKYPQRSVLLAVEAVKAEQPLHGVWAAAAEQSLREALGVIGGRSAAIADGPITILAISADNRWLVTGSWDETARLWDLRAKDPAGEQPDVWAGEFIGISPI